MSWLKLSESGENSMELANKQTYYNPDEIELDESDEWWRNATESEINLMVNQVLSSNGSSIVANVTSILENLKSILSDWQISELDKVRESESGIRCLLNSWLVTQKDFLEGKF